MKFLRYGLILFVCMIINNVVRIESAYREDDISTFKSSEGFAGLHPVLQAVLVNDPHRLDELIAAHADVNEGYYTHKPLYHARSAEMVEKLVKAGAVVNPAKEGEFQPIHFAATKGDGEALNTLLKHGAEVNAKDPYGETPLLNAARVPNNEQSLINILHAGADIHAKNKKEQSALDIATEAYNDWVELAQRPNLSEEIQSNYARWSQGLQNNINFLKAHQEQQHQKNQILEKEL